MVLDANVNRYVGAAILQLKAIYYTPTSTAINGLFYISYPIVMIFVWTAIYSSGAATASVPLVLLYGYYIISGLTDSVAGSQAGWEMDYDIRQGNIIKHMIRPMGYLTHIAIEDVVGKVFNLAYFVPLLVLALWIAHVSITPYILFLFFASLVMAKVLTLLVEIIIGITAAYTTSTNGLHNFMDAVYFLSGGLIPLTMVPGWLSSIVTVLPFQYLMYFPAGTVLGLVKPTAIVPGLETEAIWIIALALFAAIFWRVSRDKIVTVGV